MTSTRRRKVRWTGTLVLMGCAVARASGADTSNATARDTKLFRFEFDNDTFIGSDDAFSAGWSVQIHSQLLDEWTPGLAGWIGRFPSLGDDHEGGRIVRWSWGVTQILITPEDISIAEPQPGDAPWAGILGGYVSWSAYDDRRLAALQLYLGCMGPCAQADDVQKFAHNDLDFGTPPQGWSNQLDDKHLLNVNYEYRRKLWASDHWSYAPRRWTTDVSVAAQVGIGSFATYAEAWIETRFGRGVPRGFTKFPDPPAFGIALDPVYLDPEQPAPVESGWRAYFSLVARVRSIREFVVLKGGATQSGGVHPEIDSGPGDKQLLLGLHVAKMPLAFHLTYYRYFTEGGVALPFRSDLDWVNFSFERRF